MLGDADALDAYSAVKAMPEGVLSTAPVSSI